jgi:hypothetical protein
MTQDSNNSRKRMLNADIGRVVRLLSEYAYPDKDKFIQELLANASDAIYQCASKEQHFQLIDDQTTMYNNEVRISPEQLELVIDLDSSILIDEIERILFREKFAFQAQPCIGGLRHDFIVYGPYGRSVILEAKQWIRKSECISRALEQSDRYKVATDSSSVLMVLPDIGNSYVEEGITDINNLADVIKKQLQSTMMPASLKPISCRSKIIFAAMPFSNEYDDTFFVAMVPAAEELGAVCIRVDNEEFSGDIVSQIQSLLRESIAVIADLSDAKPNVLYEIGYAHALDKPIAHITSTSPGLLPFDVRNWNTILYEKGKTHALQNALVERLRAIIG